MQANDLVMRTSFGKIFHSNCFKCSICERSLKKGDEYFMNDENIFCKYDYELAKVNSNSGNNVAAILQLSTTSSSSISSTSISPSNIHQQQQQHDQENEHNSNNTSTHHQLINNSNSSFNSNPSNF